MPKTKNFKIPLTAAEICGLKIRCTEAFATVASKAGLETGRVFDLGNKLWDECVETIYQNENGGLAVIIPDPKASEEESKPK